MSKSSSPAVTFMLQYTEPTSRYVDYMNRDEAVQLTNELELENRMQGMELLTESEITKIRQDVPELQLNFEDYIGYMNRSYATGKQTEEVTAIFTQDTNHMQRSKVSELKEKLNQAYQNGSLLWQGVISFDNQFLAQEGLYDLATGQVDQQAIKAVVREALPKMIAREGLSDSAFWWANIHLNTDNIHVHFGLSEVESNREQIFYRPRGRMEYKGNFSQKTMDRLKSEIFHGLIHENTRSNIIRKEQVLVNLKSQLLDQVFRDNQVRTATEKNFLEQAYNHLPLSKKWRYGSNARDFAVSKFFIDRYLDSYLKNDGRELYQEFLDETRQFLQVYQNVYSADENKSYEKLRQIDGNLVRSQELSKGYQLEKLLAAREYELREHLANKILVTFRQEAPRIQEKWAQSNLSTFSQRNQERIWKQYPAARIVRTGKDWEKLGYQLKNGEQPLKIIKPVYAAYDKYGNGLGEASFVEEAVYDIGQMEENIDQKQLGLKDLSVFSRDELKALVDAAKKKPDPSPKEVQELGIFRYALKLSSLEERKGQLLAQQKLLNQVDALDMDRPFVIFKQQQLQEELKLVNLQLIPNYKLSPEDRALKERLSAKFQDSVTLSIDKAEAGVIQLPIRRLREEMNYVQGLKDEGILLLLQGKSISKKEYLNDLQTHISIFQLKNRIQVRNRKIEAGIDNRELKIENAKAFQELKNLYASLSVNRDQDNQLSAVVSKRMEAQKVLKKENLLQSKGKAQFNLQFLNSLSRSLDSAQRANRRALMERERGEDQERYEQDQEEKEQLL
ncbi:hypothetical protein E5983_01725 [Streptococcus danieliae]|uniref:ATPase involved in DNA repair n=1 Tax=Streptococcus danieliae TaxID=747656 RepID=A0A7X3KC99_9STRE|nr:MobP2 family relaxase [Streptococcus danieliae]MVX58373.1 hypothetical protein [Streptococcus danieliae]